MKAAVPYTTQADEALIANGVPQTATIDRAKAKFTPQIDGGSPDMRPIPDTGLSYVFNSPTPIIMVSADAWYAVQNGVWFIATWALGPWAVATSVPAVIYSIPASSPLHYVTYVQIYNATPQVVVVGYTPGYLGTVVAPGRRGRVRHGLHLHGLYRRDRLVSAAGHVRLRGESVAWTPWTGWAIGFGLGIAFGAAAIGASSSCWGYCPAPYWGAMPYPTYGGAAYGALWRRGGVGAAAAGRRPRATCTSSWGSTGAVTRTSGGYNAWTGNAWSNQVGHSYNSMTGRVSAGERGSVQNVYTGNYAYGGAGRRTTPPPVSRARGGSSRMAIGTRASRTPRSGGRCRVRTASRPASQVGRQPLRRP